MNETREYRHALIQEFREVLTSEEYVPLADTQAVIVLSGPPEYTEESVNEKSPENRVRIDYGIRMAREIAAHRLGIPADEIDAAELADAMPSLVLNGDSLQVDPMREMAIEDGFPEDRLITITCGERGPQANTQTQIHSVNEDPVLSSAAHLTFVTSSYHVPRVERTIRKNLAGDAAYDVVGVPHSEFPVDVYRVVRGEVKRIERYSRAGFIES